MKRRHRKKILPVTGNISHAFSRLIDEHTPKTETSKNKAISYRFETEEFSTKHSSMFLQNIVTKK